MVVELEKNFRQNSIFFCTLSTDNYTLYAFLMGYVNQKSSYITN